MKFSYRTVAKEYRALIKEKGSSFLGILFPVDSEESFKKHLQVLKDEFPDATHHCFAFRLDQAGKLSRSSDDGEPTGTAGKPILNQLLSADLAYTALVVVRYFGGTKLGTGGLIKAYKEASKAVISQSEIVEEVEKVTYKISFAFELSADVNRILKNAGAILLQKEADEKLHLYVQIPKGETEELERKCLDNRSGEITLVLQ